MAKQISEGASIAFTHKHKFKRDNTQVKLDIFGLPELYLFGNKIAWCDVETKQIKFTMCGWNSRTTKDRLSALGIIVVNRDSLPYWKVNQQTLKPISSTGVYTTNIIVQ